MMRAAELFLWLFGTAGPGLAVGVGIHYGPRAERRRRMGSVE